MPVLTRTIAAAALIALAATSCALAQTPPSGGVSSYEIGQTGLSVQADTQHGASVQLNAGEAGGLSVSAGPQGARVDLSQNVVPVPPASTPPQPTGPQSGDAAQPARGQPARGDAP